MSLACLAHFCQKANTLYPNALCFSLLHGLNIYLASNGKLINTERQPPRRRVNLQRFNAYSFLTLISNAAHTALRDPLQLQTGNPQMKVLQVLLLGSLFGVAMAANADSAEQQVPVEEYNYSQHLDIAHVLSVSSVPNVCEVVPAQMVYEDSQGHTHVLEYRVMGNGCSNG